MGSQLPFCSIEQAIALYATQFPSHVALIVGSDRMSYLQLDQAVNRQCVEFGALQGRSVVFRATCDVQSVVYYFAIHRSGGVAVPLDKNMPNSLYDEMSTCVAKLPCPAGTADLLFTTGTTGQPKGVMVSHKAMVANADNLVEAQGYHVDLTFIVNGPLNHIGSLSKLYTTLFAGGTVHIIDGIKDINSFFSAVYTSRGSVATFLVPASIRMLISFASDALREVGNRMEFVETGAAPLMQSDMEQFCRLLPATRLFNTYASTETGIIATHDFNHDLRLSGCLGKSMKHSHLCIDSLGHVVCSGDTLMTGYWNNPELTHRLLTADGFVTNDLGRFDAEGRLRLEGRNDDVINVGGFKIAPTEVEEQALASGMVDDCICVPYSHPVIGTAIRLLVVVESQTDFSKRAILLWLKQRLEAYKLPQDILVVDRIERTANGKLNRKAYV